MRSTASGPSIEEFLYPAMEDYRIEIRLGRAPKAQTMTMQIERFTLVGATTRFGLLTAPCEPASESSSGWTSTRPRSSRSRPPLARGILGVP